MDEEREHVKSSIKIIEKLKKHSRDYLEVQKKTHQILTAGDGLHYTMYMKKAPPSANTGNAPQAEHAESHRKSRPPMHATPLRASHQILPASTIAGHHHPSQFYAMEMVDAAASHMDWPRHER